MKIISSNNSNPTDMLRELAKELKGKGQIEANYFESSPKSDGVGPSCKVSFGRMDMIDKLMLKLGVGGAKVKRDAAFDKISELIDRSNLPMGDRLLRSIGRVMQTTGKLRGDDIAGQIAIYLDATDSSKKMSSSTQRKSDSVIPSASENKAAIPVPLHPKRAKLAPGTAGLHFVKDNPLRMDAARIIVPTSMALREGIVAIREDYASTLPGPNGESYVIAMEDRPSKSSDISSSETIHQRYTKLLSQCIGAVVISPVADDRRSLEAIVKAAHDVCQSNRNLSVTFAVPDKIVHARITDVYSNVRKQLQKDA